MGMGINKNASYDYKYSDDIKQLKKLKTFMTEKVKLLDKNKDIDILHLLCQNFDMYEELFDKMISFGFILDNKCLDEVLKTGSLNGTTKILKFNIPIVSEHLKIAKNNEVTELLFKAGYIPNGKDLTDACKRLNLKILKNILAYKVPIAREHFKTLISSPYKSYNEEEEEKEGDILKISYMAKHKEQKYNDLVEELIRFGYMPDYDDVVYACQYHITIKNPERFNIVPGKELFEVCKKAVFLPKYDFVGVGKEEIELLQVKIDLIESLIPSGIKPSPTKIKKIIGKHKLVIDDDIMNYVFCHGKMYAVAEHLISLGGSITEKCFDILIENVDTNDNKMIAEGYKKLMTGKVAALEAKVKELEKEIDLLKEK